MIKTSCKQNVWWVGRVERSTHVSKRRFVEFSVKRRAPRETDTASRREEACLLNPCNVVAQLVTSQPVTVDTTVTFFSHSDVLGPSRITRKKLSSSIVHSELEHVLSDRTREESCKTHKWIMEDTSFESSRGKVLIAPSWCPTLLSLACGCRWQMRLSRMVPLFVYCYLRDEVVDAALDRVSL